MDIYPGFIKGCDVSVEMVRLTALRGYYSEVLCADCTEFLEAAAVYGPCGGIGPAGHDLVLSADTFIYVGALRDTFEAASRALRPGGLFVFTAEEIPGNADDGGKGFMLRRDSGRYAHSEGYIRQLAGGSSFDIAVVSEGFVLRREEGCPIDGKIYILQKRNLF